MTGILSGSTRGEIHRIVERHRRELLRLERGAASEMVRAYGGIWQRLKAELDRLLEEWQATDNPSASWVYEHNRLYNFQRQVEAELRRFADYAEAQIIANEREAVTAAGRHFQEILTTTARGRPGIVGAWDRLPTPAIEDLVGFTANGSPLRVLLDELGLAASEAVRSGLIEGLALGQNPREIARRIREEFGGDLVRALRISRTETLRSYREATRRNYQANSDIIAGWRWLAAKQGRTCAMCLAMDGTFHTLDEHLDDHPNGRCAMVPVLKGEEGAPPVWETGSEWLDKQPEAVQRKVLGNAGYEAYKAGAVTLQDFVGQKHSHAWGSTRYAKSLKEILGPEEAKKWAGIEKKQPPGLSPHPVDQLIRDIIRSGQPASTAEVTQITTRVAQADFPTITRHVNKRVGEKQWADGITEKEYLADIRRAVLDKESRLVIYERHGGNIAGILAETAKIVPESRRGRDFLPLLFVAYSADRGIILSGYQASVLEKISIPENARWLK